MRRSTSILLVTPFADEAGMYAEYLRHIGFDPTVCEDSAEAWEIITTRQVEGVVTRVHGRSRTDGIELTRRIRRDSRTRDVPVIVLTSHMEAEVHARALEAGCDALLLLPCLPDDLEVELRRLISRERRSGV